jgi:hypothetical protein
MAREIRWAGQRGAQEQFGEKEGEGDRRTYHHLILSLLAAHRQPPTPPHYPMFGLHQRRRHPVPPIARQP